MKTRTLVVLLDADGCFYNQTFHDQLLYLICHHGDFIRSIPDTLSAHPDDWLLKIDLQDKLEKIVKEAMAVKIDKQYRHAMIQYAKNKYWPEKKTNPVSEQQMILGDLFSQYIVYLDAFAHEVIDEILCTSNEPLINHIKRSVEQDNVQKIIFMVGSNRQSMLIDQLNAHKNGTRPFFQDLVMLTERMQHAFPASRNIQVSLDKFIMADVYNNVESGETYGRILNDLNNHVVTQHNETIFDHTKMTTIYAYLHYLAVKYKDEYQDKNMLVAYYDDRMDILNALDSAFNKKNNLKLLPQNMSLTMCH